ncbi:MAG TPA: TolC family protein [Terriglobia bacterium]|nr:TolC family protein [Terriglobia bacterium]
MRLIRLISLTCFAALATASCHFQAYRPQPISPPQTAASLEARTLNDPGLKEFIEKSLGHSINWPPEAWDFRLLTLAAFYFSPSLQSARDRLAFAQGGEVTARMRPNPTLSFSPGIPSPYLISLDFLVPVMTAGKRGYQIETAKNLSEAARLNLAQTAWNVRSAIRAALINEMAAEQAAAVLRSEAQLRRRRVARLGEQLTAGEIAMPVVTASRVDLLNAQLALQASEGQVAQTRSALAAAIGIPISGLGNAQFAWPALNQLPALSSLSPRGIQRAAVVNRLDVRQALLQYQAAQSSLQLQIARQHPDFNIGPGYQFEEGHSYFAPSFGITLPIFNRNQGPIAQAEAARKQAADNLLAIQAQAIAQCDLALARYRTAYQQFQKAQSVLVSFEHIQSPMARRAVSAGEADRLSLNTVLLQQSAATEVVVTSLLQAQTALGQLEAAVERPLEPGDAVPLIIAAPKGGIK